MLLIRADSLLLRALRERRHRGARLVLVGGVWVTAASENSPLAQFGLGVMRPCESGVCTAGLLEYQERVKPGLSYKDLEAAGKPTADWDDWDGLVLATKTAAVTKPKVTELNSRAATVGPTQCRAGTPQRIRITTASSAAPTGCSASSLALRILRSVRPDLLMRSWLKAKHS
jgi:hypothetical protein